MDSIFPIQIVERQTDTGQFLQELYSTWNELIEQRSRYPAGGRINVIEIYSKMVLNRQNTRSGISHLAAHSETTNALSLCGIWSWHGRRARW